MITENYTGLNCSGTDGQKNRILTLANNSLTVDNGLLVVVSNLTLHPSIDYTISHLLTGSTITFLNNLWNEQNITIHYNTSISPSQSGSGVIPLNGQLINNEINYYGTNVTLRIVTKTGYSDYGDATETISDSTIKTFFNNLTNNDEYVKEGIFKAGDKIFFFEGSQDNIDRGNRIQVDSDWYEIDQVIETKIGGVVYGIEARARKI